MINTTSQGTLIFQNMALISIYAVAPSVLKAALIIYFQQEVYVIGSVCLFDCWQDSLKFYQT